MFLAWQEIIYSKKRFALIFGVIILISYLVFFLTGLAYGLADENRTSIDKWEADGIILSDESNLNINMSMFPKDLTDDVEASEKAILGLTSNVVSLEGEEDEDQQVDVTFFGIDEDEFIMPDIIEGDAFSDTNEVIADISLKEEEEFKIGDELDVAGVDSAVTITGFTEDSKFNVAPVLYSNHETYQSIRASGFGEREDNIISAIVVRTDDEDLSSVTIDNDDLEVFSINEFILELPGYTAQLLTFGLMIGFLVLIAAMIIGIFIYVLTIQKSSMFGVMKAQGISSKYIAKSVVGQTFLLTAFGVGVGLLLTLGTGLLLPPGVPYQNNSLFFLGITALLILFAVIGAFFSVRAVVKIDPLEAMD